MARITFDLNGTLLDPGERSEELQRAVRLAQAYAQAGRWVPLSELLDPPEQMPPFPDVPAGLDALRAAGHELSVLTNSATATGEAHLERAGIRDRFARVVGVDRAETYKPDPRAYALVQSDWLVAAHVWDVLGAGVQGIRTAYLAREGPLPRGVAADLVAGDLAALAQRFPAG